MCDVLSVLLVFHVGERHNVNTSLIKGRISWWLKLGIPGQNSAISSDSLPLWTTEFIPLKVPPAVSEWVLTGGLLSSSGLGLVPRPVVQSGLHRLPESQEVQAEDREVRRYIPTRSRTRETIGTRAWQSQGVQMPRTSAAWRVFG